MGVRLEVWSFGDGGGRVEGGSLHFFFVPTFDYSGWLN